MREQLIVAMVMSLPVLPFVGLTIVGAGKRGNGPFVALVSGLCFPVTWLVWYLVDTPSPHR